MNEFCLSGDLVERSAARYSPAGVAVVEAQIRCRSDVMEAGHLRTVDFCVGAVGVGPMAAELERLALGARLELSGFVAPRSRRSSRLVLHVTGCKAVSADEGR